MRLLARRELQPVSARVGFTAALEPLTISGAEGSALVDGKGQCCHGPSQTNSSNLFMTLEDAEFWNPAPQPEMSRQRLRRRRQVAAKIMRGRSPRPQSEVKENSRGRWYPVSACGTVPAIAGMTIEARASGRVDRIGIMRCGSVWTCPECAQIIAAARGNEIKRVIERARKSGCRIEMVTFTLPHDLSLPAEECMRRLKESLRKFSSDGTAARRLRELGFIGQVRSIEVTRGWTSGWHFHAHAILVFEAHDLETNCFVRPVTLVQTETYSAETFEVKVLTIDEETLEVKPCASPEEDFAASRELKRVLFPVWKRAAEYVGAGTPSFRHGLDVRAVWSATDYTAKMPEQAVAKSEAGKARWGADAELSKAYMKEGRKKSRTVWEILDTAETNPADAELFAEYAAATWGRSQIEWSKGKRDLRKIFLADAEELDDERLVYEEPDWVFADEVDELPDLGETNLVTERITISSSDAWRARHYNFGSIDRACAAVEKGDALFLADVLAAEGWIVEKTHDLRYESEMRKNQYGNLQKYTVVLPAEYVATWPPKREASE